MTILPKDGKSSSRQREKVLKSVSNMDLISNPPVSFIERELTKQDPVLLGKLVKISDRHEVDLNEVYYIYLNTDSDYRDTCIICGGDVRFYIKHGYKRTCGQRCAQLDPQARENHKKACLKNSGYENPSQNPAIKKKKTDTCLKNFGVPHTTEFSC